MQLMLKDGCIMHTPEIKVISGRVYWDWENKRSVEFDDIKLIVEETNPLTEERNQPFETYASRKLS